MKNGNSREKKGERMTEFLQSIDLFADMSGEEIGQILTHAGARMVSYEKNQVIFREGEQPRYIFVLLGGRLLISKHLPSGRRNVICEIHEKEIFGILVDPFQGETYWYDAMALADCQALCIPWEFLFDRQQMASELHLKFVRNMFRVQSDINVYQMKKLNILAGATLEARIGRLILQRMDAQGRADFQMNREELADYLGVTRPSLSRSLMQMQRKGLIRVDRWRVQVCNLNELEKLCIR